MTTTPTSGDPVNGSNEQQTSGDCEPSEDDVNAWLEANGMTSYMAQEMVVRVDDYDSTVDIWSCLPCGAVVIYPRIHARWHLTHNGSTFLGLGGGGEAHVDPARTPDACWMPGSGAVRATEGT